MKKELLKPWISFGSDAASQAPEGVFLKSNPHPRAYGNFARLLGKYVRDEKVIPLAEAVRRLSGLPATNLGLDHRGFIKEGMFADIAIFEPATIADRATFEKPHQYAVGVKHVFVNGVQVLKDGEHTGAIVEPVSHRRGEPPVLLAALLPAEISLALPGCQVLPYRDLRRERGCRASLRIRQGRADTAANPRIAPSPSATCFESRM